MDDLVNRVSTQVGISEDMSQQAVSIVVNYLKRKLPAPVAGQIDSVLGGQESSEGLGDKVKDMGGMFGGRE